MGKIYFKNGVQFVGRQGDIGLFYVFGNKLYVQGSFVDEKFELISRELESGIEFADETRPLSPALISLDSEYVKNILHELDRNGLTASGAKPLELSNSSRLIHWIFKGQAPQALVDEQDNRIAIFNFGHLEYPLFKLLNLLRLGHVRYYDDRSVSPSDLEHSPEFYSEGDLGRSRVEVIRNKPFPIPLETDRLDAFASSAHRPRLAIVMGAWPDREHFRKLNAIFLERSIPWVPVIQDTFGGSIGPFLGIKDGPCFECLIARKQSHSYSIEMEETYHRHFHSRGNHLQPPPFRLFSEQLAAIAATEAFKFIHQAAVPELCRNIVEFDFLNNRRNSYPIYPKPFCLECHEAEPKSPSLARNPL